MKSYETEVAVATVYFFCLTVASSCSDNEEDRVSQNGRPAKSEFKDDEETITNKSVQITQTTDAITSTTTSSRKRGGVPSKTVDLGAAAHYTGSKSSPDADNNKVKYTAFIQIHPAVNGALSNGWLRCKNRQDNICPFGDCNRKITAVMSVPLSN